MANYTTADIKALREKTGAGMLDVKKALDEANGDAEKAIEIIRVKGLKGIAKREGRAASAGLIAAKVVEDGGSQVGSARGALSLSAFSVVTCLAGTARRMTSERVPQLREATASMRRREPSGRTGRSETTRRRAESRPIWVVVDPRSQIHPRISCSPKRTMTRVPGRACCAIAAGTR